MHGFAALDIRPRQRYTADKAASDKAAAAFDNILLYFTPVQSLHKIWDRPTISVPPHGLGLFRLVLMNLSCMLSMMF